MHHTNVRAHDLTIRERHTLFFFFRAHANARTHTNTYIYLYVSSKYHRPLSYYGKIETSDNKNQTNVNRRPRGGEGGALQRGVIDVVIVKNSLSPFRRDNNNRVNIGKSISSPLISFLIYFRILKYVFLRSPSQYTPTVYLCSMNTLLHITVSILHTSPDNFMCAREFVIVTAIPSIKGFLLQCVTHLQ